MSVDGNTGSAIVPVDHLMVGFGGRLDHCVPVFGDHVFPSVPYGFDKDQMVSYVLSFPGVPCKDNGFIDDFELEDLGSWVPRPIFRYNNGVQFSPVSSGYSTPPVIDTPTDGGSTPEIDISDL